MDLSKRTNFDHLRYVLIHPLSVLVQLPLSKPLSRINLEEGFLVYLLSLSSVYADCVDHPR